MDIAFPSLSIGDPSPADISQWRGEVNQKSRRLEPDLANGRCRSRRSLGVKIGDPNAPLNQPTQFDLDPPPQIGLLNNRTNMRAHLALPFIS
jgi:hypothetical protein